MEKHAGFIGLGIMGEPMARNLLAGGFRVTAFNRTREKAAALERAGADIVSSPRAVGEAAETVLLMLTGPEAIEEILRGDEGLLGRGSRCRTVINMSTVSPAYTKELDARLFKARSVQLIDAPVSGSKKPAEDGTLVILASGHRERVEALEPLFLTMGKKVVYCGETGMGSSMKMFINLLLCVMITGLSEALTLGEKCGLSKKAMLETVLAGPLGCGLFTMKADMFKTGEYPVQFPFKHMYKDLELILATADKYGMETGIGGILRDLYKEGMEKGLADLDFAAVKKVIEQ